MSENNRARLFDRDISMINVLADKIQAMERELNNLKFSQSASQPSFNQTVVAANYSHVHNRSSIINLDDDSDIDHGGLSGLTDEDHSLSAIANTTGDKTFTFANKGIKFKFTGVNSGAYDGMFELEMTGNLQADVMHIHQHTGNVVAGSKLLHLHGEDADLLELEISGQGPVLSIQDTGDSDEELLEFDTTARTLRIGAADGDDDIAVSIFGVLAAIDSIPEGVVTAHEGAIDHNALTNTHNLTNDISHDSIADVSANDHHTPTVSGDIDHDATTNTHDLTNDIDHDAIANFEGDEHVALPNTSANVINDMLDEDNMATDSDTQAATQQSIKKYVDDEVASKAAISHAMSTHSDEDTYNINTSGSANVGSITLNTGETVDEIDDVMDGTPSDEQLLTANAVKTYVDVPLRIGAGNVDYMPCIFEGASPMTVVKHTSILTPTSSTNLHAHFAVPLPTNRGGLKLYIRYVIVHLSDADGSNYVNETYLRGCNESGSTVVDSDGTNLTSAGEKTLDMGGSYNDCSSYDTMKIQLACSNNSADNLDITSVKVDYYYAA